MHVYRHFGRCSVFQRSHNSSIQVFGQVAHCHRRSIRPDSPPTYRLRGAIPFAHRASMAPRSQPGVGVWRETSECSTRVTLGNSPNGLCKGDPLF